MLLLIPFLLLAADKLLIKPSSGSSCGFGYELLVHRLEQLESDQQDGFSELQSALKAQNSLLESIVARLAALENKTITQEKEATIESCSEVPRTGRYRLRLPNRDTPLTVQCEKEQFGAGWLVIQYRFDGSVNFNRSWADYRDGFGTVGGSGEFWLGLETVHQLTQNGHYELQILLKRETTTDKKGFGRYSNFKIAGEKHGYQLALLGDFSGTINDRLLYSKNENFTTSDRDLDQLEDENCAQTMGGGWWFTSCGWSSLNGPFRKSRSSGYGIYWEDWTDAATYGRMMIRRK